MEPRLLHRKDALILAAIEIINDSGFQGLTTKEIAKREGISESTIFKHFKSKNELICAVLDHFSQYDEAIIESVKSKDLTPGEAILYFMESYVSYYENYPEITAVIHAFDSLMMQPEFQDKVGKIYFKRNEFIQLLLDQAKASGAFHPLTDTEGLTDVIIGTEKSINLKWRISHYSFSLKEKTLSTIKMILDAFVVKSKEWSVRNEKSSYRG